MHEHTLAILTTGSWFRSKDNFPVVFVNWVVLQVLLSHGATEHELKGLKRLDLREFAV